MDAQRRHAEWARGRHVHGLTAARDARAFSLGSLVFAVGTLLAIASFALSIAAARAEGAYAGSLPLLTYGVACAAILALLSVASGRRAG